MVHRRRRGTAIVDSPNGILVVSEGGRTYYLPGGGARRGESRKNAAIRELMEETGLRATRCSYLFEYTSFSNHHKVFLIETKGVAEPRNEIKYLAYFNGSNINVSDTTRRIIELYYGNKKFMPEYVKLRCSHCGAPLNATDPSPSIECDYCGTVYYKKV